LESTSVFFFINNLPYKTHILLVLAIVSFLVVKTY